MPKTDIDYYSYEESKALVRKLGLKSEDDWRAWLKLGRKDPRIPANPYSFYKKRGEWISMGDWLGTSRVANQNKKFEDYSVAKGFARSLNIKTSDDWKNLCVEGKVPDRFPRDPRSTYKNDWESWGEFLGTGRVASQNYRYASYAEAQEFYIENKILTKKIHTEAKKNVDWPAQIPKTPWTAYPKEWKGWNNFVKTQPSSHGRGFTSFADARARVRKMGIKTQEEFRERAKTDKNWPGDIPKLPWATYKKSGEWTNLNDFLGTEPTSYNRAWRSFAEARAYVRELGIQRTVDYQKWAKSRKCPKDIPRSPDAVYAEQWVNWTDWLGNYGVMWKVGTIRAFVKSLLPHLKSFTAAELYVLLQQNGLTESDGKSKSFIQALKTGRFPTEELEKFVNQKESLVDKFIEGEINSLEEGINVDAVTASEGDVDDASFEKADDSADQAALPEVNVSEVLSSLDDQVVSSADEEAIEFLVASALAKLWKRAYVALDDAVTQAKSHKGGEYSARVRMAFLSEVERAQTLPVPKGYNFRVNNKLTEPNLMQRHLAARLMSHKRVGNWSGTGAGKTLSAIYSSRLIDAKLTVICCPNSVVSGWVNNIKSIFPDSEVQEKTWQPSWSEDGKARYLVLNFEAFQQTDSENNVSQFCSRNQVNLLVVDEIHYAKQRHSENMSKRRQLITAFSSLSSQGSENYYVLGMSATPVINNLHEGKSLIDLVTGINHEDLNVTSPSVFNCMRMHQKLVTLGIRWMPKYEANLEVLKEPVDCEDYLDDIRSLGNSGTPLELEKILTKARLPVIVKHVRRKTLIYTHYISEIDRILRDALVAEGWSVGFYTGEEKSGLDSFINGDLDVLIGSSAIGTGVDGLQTVCDQLIINVLPWTAAQYEQLIGRIHRQGQTKERVSVVIPITESKVNDAVWSWCASKLKRLEYKKSIADAVVDGVVPEGHLRTEAQAYKDVMSWLERLDKGQVITVARSPVYVNLDNVLVSEDDSKEAKKRRLSEFSRMNANWNNSLSKTTADKLSKDDSEWKTYHQLYREAREDWPVIPFEEFIRWALDRVDLEIGDFGCGEALVAKELKGAHIIHSFDHVAVNDSVIAGDMSRVPLDDCTLDVALFSLSLMGKNFTDYLREAHRTLRLDGHLHIWEATSRFKDIDHFEKQLQSLGFNKYQRNIGDKFTHLHLIKSGKRVDESVVVSF